MNTAIVYIFTIIVGLTSSLLVKSKEASYKVNRIVFVGNSLTDGYGISKDKAFPSLLQKKLQEQYFSQMKVLAAGESGSVSASGMKRLKWLPLKKSDLVVIELGANDILRGISPKHLLENLQAMVSYLNEKQIHCAIMEMKTPPNYGREKSQKYENVFSDFKNKDNVYFIPFLLSNVAGVKKYNLEDGIHPNTKGHEIVASDLYPKILAILKDIEKKP